MLRAALSGVCDDAGLLFEMEEERGGGLEIGEVGGHEVGYFLSEDLRASMAVL